MPRLQASCGTTQRTKPLSVAWHLAQVGSHRGKGGQSRIILLAIAFVLVGATDYDPHVLIERGHVAPLACATSLATCEAAVDAIHAGRWHLAPADADLSCRRAHCFQKGSDCIRGYNC